MHVHATWALIQVVLGSSSELIDPSVIKIKSNDYM
jgi:hypothetical protein